VNAEEIKKELSKRLAELEVDDGVIVMLGAASYNEGSYTKICAPNVPVTVGYELAAAITTVYANEVIDYINGKYVDKENTDEQPTN
jgi:tRNA splicing ligase